MCFECKMLRTQCVLFVKTLQFVFFSTNCVIDGSECVIIRFLLRETVSSNTCSIFRVAFFLSDLFIFNVYIAIALPKKLRRTNGLRQAYEPKLQVQNREVENEDGVFTSKPNDEVWNGLELVHFGNGGATLGRARSNDLA